MRAKPIIFRMKKIIITPKLQQSLMNISEQMSEEKNFNPSESLLKIQNAIKEGQKQIVATPKAVILIGDTGEGKSTLTHLIARNPLTAIKMMGLKKKLIFKEIKPLGTIKIGDGLQSTTTLPNKWQDKERKITYWDCPGFNDSKGFEQDIINAFYIKKIFDVSEEMKLILVVSEDTLDGMVIRFANVLLKLEKLLGNLKSINLSLSLVVTKASIQKVQQLKEHMIERFLPNMTKIAEFSAGQKYLLEYLASTEGKVSLFHQPTKHGPVDTQDNAYEIKTMIDSTSYIKKPQIRITVAPTSELKLNEFGKFLNEKIENLFERANDLLERKCRQIIQNENQCNAAIAKLLQIGDHINKIKQPKEANNFLPNYFKLSQNYKIDRQLKQQIQASVNLLNFIRLIKPQISNNLTAWISKINVHLLTKKLIQKPEILISDHQTQLNVKGFLIGTNQISQLLEKNVKIEFVNVICLDTFFVQCDLIASGVIISIYAQNWVIFQNRKILLKGLGGQKNPAQKSQKPKLGNIYYGFSNKYKKKEGSNDGSNGLPGEPGKPGKPGGSFLGKLMSKKNIFGNGKLLIDVRGGDGSEGDKGKDGKKGRKGSDGDVSIYRDQTFFQTKPKKEHLISRIPYSWKDKNGLQRFNQVWKTFITFNGQMIETYLSQGKKGQKGGNGGKGGAGGLGGQSGQILLQGFDAQKIVGNGISGQNGQPGKAGEGGQDGATYKGQYINETIFTSFREASKEIIFAKKTGHDTHEGVDKILGSAGVVVGTVGTLVVKQVAGQIGRDVMRTLAVQGVEQVAVQGVKKTVIQNSTAVFVGGVCSFGLSICAQGLISAISQKVSSGWIKQTRKKIEGQKAQQGIVPQEPNYEGQVKPEPAFKFTDSFKHELEKTYEKQYQKFIQSIEYFPRQFCKLQNMSRRIKTEENKDLTEFKQVPNLKYDEE